MATVLEHKDALIRIEELAPDRRRIMVDLADDDLFSPVTRCETSYPVELIRSILELKGPAWLCDEILRDESPNYVQKSLKYDLLGYVDEEAFRGARLLDFGCGSGASTMILARMFPNSKIVGIELEKRLLEIGRLRAAHYGYESLELLQSPAPNSLPPTLEPFDYVVLSAVYEHLLPNERAMVLPQIWNILKPGGILFLNQTPYRYFPIETHTTSGLPILNYLPDRLAHWYAAGFSKRNLKNLNWEDLLRKGIRGGTVHEITRILSRYPGDATVLEPSRLGLKDRIDLWYVKSGTGRASSLKKVFRLSTKALHGVTRLVFVPNLSLAIRKTG